MIYIIIILLIAHCASVRLVFHYGEETLNASSRIEYMVRRGFREEDYPVMPTLPGATPDEFSRASKDCYNERMKIERHFFSLTIAFFAFYLCAALLSLLGVLYLLKIIG